MSDDLKERVLELAAIAKACPDNLQEKCFELLLSDYLSGRSPAAQMWKPEPAAASVIIERQPEDLREGDGGKPDGNGSSQQDVKPGDLHMKARKFLQKYSLTIDDVNALFYKEGDELKPLYEDLKTTRMAEGQIRVTLLQALMAGMKTGEFVVDGEQVRAECTTRKSYDPPNFAANFRNNANLFEAFEKYEKGTPLRLSEDGRKELAELMKELAK